MIIIYTVTFLLFFLPLLVLPLSNFIFESSKVILAEILIELLLIFTLFRYPLSKLKASLIRFWPLLGLLLLTTADLILYPSPTSFFGNSFRLQGIFLLWHLMFFSFLSVNIGLDQKLKLIYPVSLVALFLGTLILGGNDAQRAIGTLGEPNALAACVIFIWPFAFLIPPSSKKVYKLLIILISLAIILLSGSRSGLLAILIQLVFIALTKFKPQSLGKFTLVALILIAASLILPVKEGGGWYENRSEVWTTATSAGLQSPILGWGFGNLEYALKQASSLLGNNIRYQYVDSSHNFLLDYWVQGGVLGASLILIIITLSLKGLIKKRNRLLISAFVGVLTVMSFNPVSVVTLLAFWFLIGQGLSSE